jgi:cytochrome c oxidase assembly protein subunit 15
VRLPRLSPQDYRRITLFALLALAFIIVTGAAVRLTGSGLGCSDWPTCEQDQFVARLEFHPMVEFVNRLITGLVSIAVILAVLGSLVRVPRRRDLTWLSIGLVLGVIAQIILGAIVVKVELDPLSVIGHFLVSVVLVANAVVLHDRAGHGKGRGTPCVPRGAVLLGRLMVFASAVVLVAGTVVTATGPHGGDEDAERLDRWDITEVVRTHAVAAWVLLALTIVTLAWVHRAGAPRQVDRRGAMLTAAILVQGVIGYVQYFSGVPPLVVLLHVAGSIVVWIAVLRFHLGLFVHPKEVDADDPPAADARERRGESPTDGELATIEP